MNVKFIYPSFEVDMYGETGIDKLKRIEQVGRTCYRSQDKITDDSYERFVRMIMKNNHTAIIEFASFGVKFICDRSVSHQLVRARLASFAQQSQRYCDYNDCMTFIIPVWADNIKPTEVDTSNYNTKLFRNYTLTEHTWFNAAINSALTYKSLRGSLKPEEARSVLINSAATEINISTNLREWLHVFKLRSHHTADPEMRRLMEPLYNKISGMIPIVFDNILGD